MSGLDNSYTDTHTGNYKKSYFSMDWWSCWHGCLLNACKSSPFAALLAEEERHNVICI